VEHAAGFSGGVGLWVGVVCSSPGRLLGKSWGIVVHQPRPEKKRDLSHVTQPRARVNVSCSRASDRGVGIHKKGQRRWVPGRVERAFCASESQLSGHVIIT
jgi:hypothetical protein